MHLSILVLLVKVALVKDLSEMGALWSLNLKNGLDFSFNNHRQYFSSFVPAVLHTLQSSEEKERKGCQLFVEKALFPIMHNQYLPKALLSVIQQYKHILSPSVVGYFELLSSPKDKILITDNLSGSGFNCSDFSGHLRQSFIFNQSSDAPMETCSCDMNAMLENLDHSCLRKVIWQVLAYLDFEVHLEMEKQKEYFKEPKKENKDSRAIIYMSLLEQFSKYLSLKEDFTDNTDMVKTEYCNYIELPPVLQNIEILKEIIGHPVMLTLFLGTPSRFYVSLQNCVQKATRLVTNIAKKLMIIGDTNCYKRLIYPFKDKLVDFMQSGVSMILTWDSKVDSTIEAFSPLFSLVDIQRSMENMFYDNDDDSKSFNVNFNSAILLIGLFLKTKELAESKDITLLSPKSLNSLIMEYVSLPKRRKNILRPLMLKFFERSPTSVSFLTVESSHFFTQHRTEKDLPIFGLLIDSNDVFRREMQTWTTDTSEDGIGFIYLTSKCLINCKTDDENDKNYMDSISSLFWTTLTEFLLEEMTVESDLLKECNAGEAAQKLIQESHISSKKLNKLCKLLLEKSENEVPSLSKMQVILQLFKTWKLRKHEKNKTTSPILEVTLKWLTACLSEEFCFWDLTDFIKELLQDMDEFELEEIIDVNAFFSKSLKISFKFETIGREVFKILCMLCEKSHGNNMPIQSIYNLVTGHSQFFQVMVMGKAGNKSFKECIIDLLAILVKRDGTVCKENHLGLYLSSYNATMNSVDQKMLYLMKLYADNNINMNKYRPFLWGKQAVAHYSIMNDSQMYLWKQPKLHDVLNGFFYEKIKCTVLNFPLKASLLPSQEYCEVDENLADQIYDFRFYLPQFAHLFSPGSFVHCYTVVNSRILMLIFISLSSFDSDTRALGYYCLSQFYHHCEGAHFKEKDMWLALLDSVRNSINSLNPRIPSIVTLFLARVADIFTRPDHSMYTVLYKFVMIKPFLDITHVPEFYKLFNSPDIEHRVQRLWLLSLIADGLQTSLDFHICEKRYIFSSFMTHYFSCISSNQEKVLILQIISNAVKITSSARTLCQNGLLLWLHNIIQQCDSTNDAILKSLCLLMENLQSTIGETFQELNIVHLSLINKMK